MRRDNKSRVAAPEHRRQRPPTCSQPCPIVEGWCFRDRYLAQRQCWHRLSAFSCHVNSTSSSTTSSSRSRLSPHRGSCRRAIRLFTNWSYSDFLPLPYRPGLASQPVIQCSCTMQSVISPAARARQKTVSGFLLLQSILGSCCEMTAGGGIGQFHVMWVLETYPVPADLAPQL